MNAALGRLGGSLGAAVAVALGLLVTVAGPAPRPVEPRPDPGRSSPVSSTFDRVSPAVIGLRAEVLPDRPSAATLGTERWGSGVLLEPDGLAVTVGYLVLEAHRLEAVLADGRSVPARVVGQDFESGLALVRLEARAVPYPVVPLGRSTGVAPGQPVTIVGVAQGAGATGVAARVTAVRSFVAYWEYLLEEALFVAPLHPAFGGAALVDGAGALVGIISLRLPDAHVAIPVDLLSGAREALLAQGRPARAPRPWLGLRAVNLEGGVGVAGVAPAGPAHAAGLRAGDVLVRMNGDRLAGVEDFYRRLWRMPVGSVLDLDVHRDGGLTQIRVVPQDRYAVFQFRSP